ncbi:hypothetical protein CARUB_v10012459mg [Capsella rubella]|uniref:KIB1-4 beta-propeller domain-containing protein n=1 Tax=Capsella rubella TaxID=81985 RepID=R0IH59_9BRAS|nr:hypothetical protein CARUB_v10012459mg [Capsella rubella]
MGKEVAWCNLPKDLVEFLSDRLSSNIDLIHIRSICKPWRSAVATKKRFRNHFQRDLPVFKEKKTIVSPTTFFRVTLPSSCSNKGWLIRHRQVFKFSKNKLLSPLTGQHMMNTAYKTLDLLKFGVSKVCESYNVQYLSKNVKDESYSNRVVFLDNMFFVVDYENMLWCCKSGEESGSWTRINTKTVKGFLDIKLHRRNIYAIDLNGGLWWISPSQKKDDDDEDINECKETRLVEYCGDLCILHRFWEKTCVHSVQRTVGFKVYKMDEDLLKWVEVSCLGDKAIIVTIDSCFTILASEYYGCLENAIYFSEKGDDSVFKLDDGSIITKKVDSSSSSSHQSCFQMFSTSFLRIWPWAYFRETFVLGLQNF